ncbi:hypothetical protein ACFQ3P_33570 [Paraburkholderia sabiae]|jgi:uncharacterized membrane-anchored protein YhcB (DUF1043 family)|uniref:Uncharacterized protein n=1 Tax=Paraburkholderia sabiae TaxID=273251 RepID=A0ABU9QNX6_9BURK|nr:hypothetical protein [Paraburkholderia sabiae]WJZ73260.1 hypothetical protein QEN71_24435 [Paraburkholderia sabiae]CAD6553787.1 hypothetical protein LMG24235_05330 [Paraburkholderia sabiae]CAG9221796.1 conserved hypothetical protein [Paraburkholderia sabiae]
MAESMVGIVVGIVVLAVIVTLLSHQLKREHHYREGMSGRFDGHRWWERLRHRH